MPNGFIPVPDWFSIENQGADIVVADVSGNGRPDLVVFMVDNGPQQNRGLYRVGFDIDGQGNVTGGWTPWVDVPDWFSWENQGAGIAIGDIDSDGHLDLLVFTVDNPPKLNRGIYQIGARLDAQGNVTGGWSGWVDVPQWWSWDNQAGGVALADVNGSGALDLIVFLIDNPAGQNQAAFRIASDIRLDGHPALGDAQGWSSYSGVPRWFSWDNQYGGITTAIIGGRLELVVLMVDHPQGQNRAWYQLVPLIETPAMDGKWDVLSFESQVLAVHASLLHTGKVLFSSGSGNSHIRADSPDFGDVAKGVYTSVLWDPVAQPPDNFRHPDTLRGPDRKPLDLFCGGNTFLSDGSLLAAGGNLSYPQGTRGNTGRRDSCAFDPIAEQWAMRGWMAHGRWYPTLIALQDGRVLAVSGRSECDQLNLDIEIYDPTSDTWEELPPPAQTADFLGLPLYAHCFLLEDGRVLFDGGRMDDPSEQGPGILDLRHDPIVFDPIGGLDHPGSRNQSASVLLPPAQDQRIMIIAGGPEDQANATGSTAILDLRQPGPAFEPADPLCLPRMHLNAVLLPDRTVFVSGGALQREDRVLARLQSEIYDPALGEWRAAAKASVVRMYHSVALLMPDGRVLTASGNPPPYGHTVQWIESPLEELQMEIYSPPYLFGGPRPTIDAAPTEWHYGQTLTINTAAAGNIRWAHIIRAGVTTHAFDNSQRLVDLPISAKGKEDIELEVPAHATIAPPGWYMFFLVDQAGVPSFATWIHIT